MAKREIALLTLFTATLLILSGILLRYRLDIKMVDEIVRKKEAYEAVVKGSIKIRDIWAEGDVRGLIKKGKLNCKKEFGENLNIDPTFYKCNPDFLNCYIRESGGDIKALPFSDSKFVKVVNRSLTPGIKAPHYGVLVNIGKGEFNFPVILKDYCHETLLPQRIYAYGAYEKGIEDWRWDNFNRLILVDRHLVTKRDFYEWKNLENKKLKSQISKEDLSEPMTDILPGEMKDFCASRGKQVITSLVYDAATFFPGNLKRPKPFKVFRSPYPWSRQRIDSFLYQARRYADFDFKKEYCLKAYTFECQEKLKYSEFQFKSNSWIGLSNVLGGKMQYMPNPVEPLKNLWASSFYYPITSDLHELGTRQSWDGEGLEPLNLDLKKGPRKAPRSYEIGFRCMRNLANAK